MVEYETDVAELGSDVTELYQGLAPELLRFATALVGSVDAAHVLSAAVVKALASPSWGRVTNHRAYLHRAVYNEARRWLRRAAQRRSLEARASAGDRWELPTLRPDVRDAVAALSAGQRAVIGLTY